MAELLNWRSEANQLALSGELTRDTLAPLWSKREAVMKQIDTIDVAQLARVDSAGLALLIHLREIASKEGKAPVFTGVTNKLQSLITLYNLQHIVTADR